MEGQEAAPTAVEVATAMEAVVTARAAQVNFISLYIIKSLWCCVRLWPTERSTAAGCK
jgi:hypothetical protein